MTSRHSGVEREQLSISLSVIVLDLLFEEKRLEGGFVVGFLWQVLMLK